MPKDAYGDVISDIRFIDLLTRFRSMKPELSMRPPPSQSAGQNKDKQAKNPNILPPFNDSRPSYSASAIQWLKSIEEKEGITIQHAETKNGERWLNGYSVDGYCEENNTVYEFHGDYWHGNPEIFNQDEINPTSKKTFGELYELTKLKERRIEEMGFNLVVMWESNWKIINGSRD